MNSILEKEIGAGRFRLFGRAVSLVKRTPLGRYVTDSFPANLPRSDLFMVREKLGHCLNISKDEDHAGEHAARYFVKEKFVDWKCLQAQWQRGEISDKEFAETDYKRNYFTVAVGTGRAIKIEYRYWVENFAFDIDWINEVRFFQIDEAIGEERWESPLDALLENFFGPLYAKLVDAKAIDPDDMSLRKMVKVMTVPMNLSKAEKAYGRQDWDSLGKESVAAAAAYQRLLKRRLGASYVFHAVLTGVPHEGNLGRLAPVIDSYLEKSLGDEPEVVVVPFSEKLTRFTLNKAMINRAEWVSAIMLGQNRFMALGRFSVKSDRPLKEVIKGNPFSSLQEIADRVSIFADEKALLPEVVKILRRDGVKIKAEKRSGANEEIGGLFYLAGHGFMGLYTYHEQMILLPRGWTVIAPHRGAEVLALEPVDVPIFHAQTFRDEILALEAEGRPVMLSWHSLGGVISAHLLAGLVMDLSGDIPQGKLPAFEDLPLESQKLINAIRKGGVVHKATWAIWDVDHLMGRKRKGVDLDNADVPFDEMDLKQLEKIVIPDIKGSIIAKTDNLAEWLNRFGYRISAGKLMGSRVVKSFSSLLDYLIHKSIEKYDINEFMARGDKPHTFRMTGKHMAKNASINGFIHEIRAALENPERFQRIHELALCVIVEYEIPFKDIIHEGDPLVSARRHMAEHEWMIRRRMSIEGVTDREDLRYKPQLDLCKEVVKSNLDKHLLIFSSSMSLGPISRWVASLIGEFGNANMAKGGVDLPSVNKWRVEKERISLKQALLEVDVIEDTN